MTEQRERKPSQAKSVIAQQKPRDTSGKFLSGTELEAYQAQTQQAQFAMEKARMNALLGKSSEQFQQPQYPQQQVPFQEFPQSNFEAIINNNKPGASNDVNRWNTLLGRKISNDVSSNRRKGKSYRW